MRSGTLDAPAIGPSRWPPSASAERRVAEAKRVAALRDELIRQVLLAVPDAVLNGPPPGPDRLPGNAHFSFPGCEGDALLMLLDARGIECSTGSACTAGVAQPSHVLLAMGADEARARGSLRFSLGHTSTQADVDDLGAAIGDAVVRARRAAAPRSPAASRDCHAPDNLERAMGLRVLAAMSGGVDSAVAAARAVDAGHEVTGVHLALSAQPAVVPHRRARLLHDRGRPRRPPGRRRHRHPVLRLGPGRALRPRRRGRLRRRVRGGPHPQPVPALQREDQVRRAARQGARPRLRRGLHRPLRADRRGDGALHRAVDPAKDQSYVLGVLNRASSRTRCSRSATRPRRDPRRGELAAACPSPTSRTATTSASSPTATPAASWPRKLGAAPGAIVDADGTVLGTHEGAYGFTIGQRKGLRLDRPAPDGRPRYVLYI